MDDMIKMKQDLDKARGIPPMPLSVWKMISDMQEVYMQELADEIEPLKYPTSHNSILRQ